MENLDVLIYGSDRMLSRTRALVVKRAGYTAACAFDYEDAQNMILLEHPAMVMFCCSVNDADRDNLMRFMAKHSRELSHWSPCSCAGSLQKVQTWSTLTPC